MIRRKYPPLRGTSAADFRDGLGIVISLPDFDGAICATHPDPELWFPTPKDQQVTDIAVAICTDCPVRNACLAYALEHDIDHGIWGGQTATERQRVKRRAAWERRQVKFTGARRRTA